MVHAEHHDDGVRWRVGPTAERYEKLDDAVRALRRPASWPRERRQVAHWARQLLAAKDLVALDVETTGLKNAFAVQIAVVACDGTALFDRLLNPQDVVIEPDAITVHEITPERVSHAATFCALLPEFTCRQRMACDHARSAPAEPFPLGPLVRTQTHARSARRPIFSGTWGVLTRRG